MKFALSLMLGFTALLPIASSGCTAEGCNDESCEDQLIVEFHPASGRFESGTYQFDVVSGETTRTCTVTIAEDLPSGDCLPTGVSLVGSLRCEGNACQASPPQTRQVYQMVISGNPTSISVTAIRDGAVVAQTTAQPRYELCGCAPNGRFGSVSLTVAEPGA